MKEYEYIVLAIDEIFSHMITSVICLENYKRDDLSGVFRNVFKMFNELREDYKQLSNDSQNVPEDILDAQLKTKCRYKREEIFDGFIKEMQNIDETIDYKKKILDFYTDLENEDVETLEMQLMVYPYLLSIVREKEEGKEKKDGKQDN